MDPVVVYDARLEMSALVDTDTMRGLGPVCVGPNGAAELSQFVDKMPQTVLEMDSYTLTRAWAEYWEREFAPLHAAAQQGNTNPVEPAADNNSDDDRIAAREAAEHAASPPEPQPADTDMETDAGETGYVGECYLCEGKGWVPGATEGHTAACGLCKGTGKLPAPVAT